MRDHSAMYNAGVLHQTGGFGLQQDWKVTFALERCLTTLLQASAEWYRKAADLVRSLSPSLLGSAVSSRVFACAFACLLAQGDERASFNLAFCLRMGIGYEKRDLAAAAQRFREAMGERFHQKLESYPLRAIAPLCEFSFDAPIWSESHRVLFVCICRVLKALPPVSAAERGHIKAPYHLGLLLDDGHENLPQDTKEALQLYWKSAEVSSVLPVGLSARFCDEVPIATGSMRAFLSVLCFAQLGFDRAQRLLCSRIADLKLLPHNLDRLLIDCKMPPAEAAMVTKSFS